MKEGPKITIILYMLALLMAAGTTGYVVLLDVSFLDALYMTIITISTVGFREVQDLNVPGKIFTIALIISGLGTVAYAFTRIVSFLAEGEFKKAMRNRNIARRIAAMKDHFIVCGASQTSMSVIDQFTRNQADFVLIEQNEDRCEELMNQGMPVIRGDATQEEVLKQANIEQSKGLVTCLNTDSDNVFVVLTAREMNPKLHIVARAIDKHAPQKLRKAGADTTISPNELGGTRMAFLMLRPHVVSFLDAITHMGEDTLDLGEVTLEEGSPLVNQTLSQVKIPEKTGLIVIAVRHPDDKLRFNPSSTEKLRSGTSMIVLGKQEEISLLRKMALLDG